MNFQNTSHSGEGDCLEVKFFQHGERERLLLNPKASYWLCLVSKSPALQFTALSTKFYCFCSWLLNYQIKFDKSHLKLPLQITSVHFPSTLNPKENRIKKVKKKINPWVQRKVQKAMPFPGLQITLMYTALEKISTLCQ